MIGIYKVTSPTDRIYIGQTIDFNGRFWSYVSMNSKTKRQIRLYRSFVKHGVMNHKFEFIEKCEVEMLNLRERYWQEHYNVLNGGLNCVLVPAEGKSGKASEETKKKISASKLKYYETAPKRIITDEFRYKCSLINKGAKNALYGKNMPEETKRKISHTIKSTGQRLGAKNGMFGRSGALNPAARLVLDYGTGIYYDTAKEAGNAHNIAYPITRKRLTGQNKNKTELRYV